MPVRSERRRLRVSPEMEGEEEKERHHVKGLVGIDALTLYLPTMGGCLDAPARSHYSITTYFN
ncbi:hypothetical protein QJS10_CPA02g01272 [Acorus calamus]|uniref:Uncharacterized protein n=1 Tax=Acorus calamus TaxID=4465 RepID=A0AAV9FGC9_ACOCL|nr:hypothetical protein QJS10_CPA02g01272 [Acorus calamus]